MRRWPFLDRLFRAPEPRTWDRCVLVVEELETRENPAGPPMGMGPVVLPPSGTSPIFEGGFVTFGGSGSFFASDLNNQGQNYSAQLTAASGTITVDEAAASSFGVAVANNGTADVTLTGQLNAISSYLSNNFQYTPTPFFSGEGQVTLTVTNPTNGASGSGSVTVKVRPVVSDASVFFTTSGQVFSPSSAFVFPDGFITVTPWPDVDGSEQATVTLSLDVSDPSGFSLFAGNTVLTPSMPGMWTFSATDPATLQAILDSLVLVPPTGFNGFVDLSVSGTLVDAAYYQTAGTAEAVSTYLGGGTVNVRFFVGGDVTFTPVFVPEGATVDLGGRFVAEDPDEMFGDVHTLTLSVPEGLFTVDETQSEGPSISREVAADGSTTITLTADIATINAFLEMPGSLVYSPPDPKFSGIVPLTITLANTPGSFSEESSFRSFSQEASSAPEAPGKFVGVAPLQFAPSADHVFPLADDAVTNQDTPVAVSIGVAALPDDSSESVLIVVDGVPDGASFNHGSDLGGGSWALSLSDLNGLTFNPPPGASGVYHLSVRAVVTDAGDEGGPTDTATESTTFTITVKPVAVSTADPDPTPTDPLLLDDFEDEDASADIDESSGADDFGDTVSADTDGDSEDQPTEPQVRTGVLPEAIAGNNAGAQDRVATDERGLSQPGQGSLFVQPEAPAPSYAGGEKHPLPPVLPLDQSSPVAGFAESGGDSFALIDKLYRDGTASAAQGNEPPAAEVAAEAPAAKRAAAPPAEQTVAVVDAAPNSDGGLPGFAELSESDARVWVAGGTVVGALIAWSRLKRAPNGRLARTARWLLRPNVEPAPAEA